MKPRKSACLSDLSRPFPCFEQVRKQDGENDERMIRYVIVYLFVIFAASASAAPPEAYPYWPEYRKVALADIKPQAWRTVDDVIDGWDWALPPELPPASNGLLAIRRAFSLKRPLENFVEPLNLPVNPTIALWIKWRDLEAVEGQVDFATLRQRIEEADALGYSVVLRLLCSATIFAPDWMTGKGIPIRAEHKTAKVTNYEISHPEFHTRYLRLIDALGKSGIPRMKNLKGAFVGYASPSYGDEGIGPHGKDPDSVPHVIERLDAWAHAFKDVKHKVFMGGISQHGLKQGFGIRRGFVEMFLYHIPDERIGQRLDKHGYLWFDEDAAALRNNPFHGEENEEYEESWATAERDFRFGKNTVSFPYRYFTSNLRLLQMRCNYALYNPFSLIPEQMVWVGQSLGRTVENTPDIWCALRESYVRNSGAVKNFERWLYQRDTEGYETEPAIKVPHSIKMWMVKKDHYFDYVARKSRRIGFAVDDRWCGGEPVDVAIKVTFFDIGTGAITLSGHTASGPSKRFIALKNTGIVKTATFFISKAVFPSKEMNHDFVFESEGDEAVLSFVRIIKVDGDRR